jgi:ribonuclease HI
MASIHVVNRRDLLENVEEEHLVVDGIGGTAVSRLKGLLPVIGEAHLIEENELNLLSWSRLEEISKIRYRQRKHVICDFGDSVLLVFKWDGIGYGAAVTQNTRMELKNSEYDRCYLVRSATDKSKDARELSRRLGYPGDRALADMLDNGGIIECAVTSRDVREAARILGPDLAALQGKYAPRGKIFYREVESPKGEVYQELHADIMHFGGDMYLVVKWKPLNLVSTKPLEVKLGNAAIVTLEEVIRLVRAHGYITKIVIVDPESILKFVRGKLSVPVKLVGTGEHVVVAEREIRTMKDRCRAILAGLEYDLPKALYPKLVEYATIMLNLVPRSGQKVASRELLTGVKLNYKRDLRAHFGEVVMVRPESGNREFSTVLALALRPEFTRRGAWVFWNINTRREICGVHWVSVKADDAIKRLIRDGPETIPIRVRSVGDVVGGGPVEDVPGTSTVPDQPVSHISAGVGETLPLNGAEATINQSDELEIRDAVESEEGASIAQDVPESEKDFEQLSENDDIEQNLTDLGTVIVDGVRRSLRMKKARVYMMLHHAYNISVRRALSTGMVGAKDAIRKELHQMLDNQVFTPVRREDVSGDIIGSHLFLTEKRDADGKFLKMKGRLVALGNLQDKDVYGNLSSPTVSGESIMLCLGLCASRKWCISTLDVTGAYLQAKMPTEHTVYMELNKELSSELCEMDKSYQRFVDSKGKLVVKLEKALYGCVQSSLLWYRTLQTFLLDYGFRCCHYDSCVYISEKVILCIHVDDILMIAESNEYLLRLQEAMRNRFGSVTVCNGKILMFLGMRINIEENAITCDMVNYTEELTSDVPDLEHSKAPAAVGLMDDDESPLLDEEERIWFHARVAKALYLVKRTRPDGLLVISKLSSRVSCANRSDMKKLKKLLGYLRSSINYGIVLKWGIPDEVEFYVDASYATDTNGRSRTGIVMTMGGQAISCWTSKQSLVARSSTEAEIIGLSEGLTQALWTRRVLEELGLGARKVNIYQDNEAVIHIMNNGRNNGQRTRHLDVRFFHAIECIENDEIILTYKPTGEMIADFFTKPVVGECFERLRNKIVQSLSQPNQEH